ncbi:hypothetical protein [Robertkochia sediminum]|uniref:hypothetical protein n=1 Tax=Robertkochia sediminum TaxID=2785326 RepID=UPI00193138B9|nr:hypothetical protein [Robertkochia sediminum]MBL7472557.1 hypothetical protein [Robertkochia sediminum]
MKYVFFAIILSVGFNLHAQEKPMEIREFIRVYDLNRNKTHKGVIQSVSDTVLQLKREGKIYDIGLSAIGKIKTKRSAGHNVFMGAVIVGAPAAILGAATADPDTILGYTAGEGFMGGTLIGGGLGAAIGGLTALFKNPKTYIINGDPDKWREFRAMIIAKDM